MKEKKNKMGEKSLFPYIKIAFFSLLLFLTVGICIFHSLFYSEYDKYKQIEIPSIIGVKEEDIVLPGSIKILKSYEYSDDEFAGRVMYQSATGKKKSEGEYTLYVKIGLGRKKSVLPSLIGKNEDTAKDMIESLGGICNIEYIESADESHKVMYQSPKKDSMILEGDIVNIFVSRKKEQKNIKVPSLEGMEIRDAIRKIKENNLTLGKIEYVFCEDVEKGIVLYQSIISDSYVTLSREISLTVSKQKQIKEMKESRKIYG